MDNELLNEITLQVFNKRFNTRGFLWLELIEIIKQKLFFGYGANQYSENFLKFFCQEAYLAFFYICFFYILYLFNFFVIKKMIGEESVALL